MAVFLLKGKFGPSHVPPPATGTSSRSTSATSPPTGCEGWRLPPYGGAATRRRLSNDPVTRAQMAVFAKADTARVRAAALPGSSPTSRGPAARVRRGLGQAAPNEAIGRLLPGFGSRWAATIAPTSQYAGRDGAFSSRLSTCPYGSSPAPQTRTVDVLLASKLHHASAQGAFATHIRAGDTIGGCEQPYPLGHVGPPGSSTASGIPALRRPPSRFRTRSLRRHLPLLLALGVEWPSPTGRALRPRRYETGVVVVLEGPLSTDSRAPLRLAVPVLIPLGRPPRRPHNRRLAQWDATRHTGASSAIGGAHRDPRGLRVRPVRTAEIAGGADLPCTTRCP
jgi:hypothetical protein